MPISKRDKKVSLTKTQKKGMSMKQQLVEDIRKFLDKYNNLFVFTINNMRNGPLKNLREEWKDSRFFFAKRKIMAIALGRTEAEEVQRNIHKLSGHLVGQCGLLFTNRPKDQVLQWFSDYSQMEFAKSGFVATETVTLPAGPLQEFSFALEPHLRSLGLPTQLEKGKIILREDYTVCTQGSKITPEQASILKLIGKQMAEFKVKIVCMWSKDGSFERFKIPKTANELEPEKNAVDTKKKKKKSNISELEENTEEKITKLFDKQTISECGTNNKKTTKHSQEKKEFVQTQLETDEIMHDETATTKGDRPIRLVVKSSKTKINVSPPNLGEGTVFEESEKITQNEELEESKNILTQKKYRKKYQTKVDEKIPNDEPEEYPIGEELEKPNTFNESPKISRENPRRSMRTPKPIRRSPEEKQSVKKLTESNKKTMSALKEKVTKSVKGTLRKSVSKRIIDKSNDVEMGE